MKYYFGLKVITPPATEPLDLAEVHLHLREDLPDQDALITSLIAAAREYAEVFQKRALVTQTLELTLDGFPTWPISLPKPPLQSVSSVKYIDLNGVEQTLAASAYQVVSTSEPAIIVPAFGEIWPQVRVQPGSVAIRYIAGYGAASAVPQAVKAAMRMLISHWYETREATVLTGATVQRVPFGVESLLWPERIGAV